MKKVVLGAMLVGIVALTSACSFTRPMIANSGNVSEATKEASATCGRVLGIITFGDCSVGTIAKNAGINEVVVVDVHDSNYVFYQGMEVIVRGK